MADWAWVLTGAVGGAGLATLAGLGWVARNFRPWV